ncbi:MAG: hypothetical protein FWE67_11735 [Planctomycetaceae bacterium]|nr:hypothetical protein [Planctomycetaceae bacterium]
MNKRNLVTLIVLAVIFLWYGTSWVYKSLYKEPRVKLGTSITQHKQGIENAKRNIGLMQQFTGQNLSLYSRSMPRMPNEVRSQYSFWFRELLKYCGIDSGEVKDDNPVKTAVGWNYRFHISGTCSLDQLSRLLFEFYSVPFLHRITAMSVATIDGKEGQVNLSMTIDCLTMTPCYQNDPYPLLNQLPQTAGVPSALMAGKDLTAYRVIAERNLLQAARGGVDKADHTYLTAVNWVADKPEVWFNVRTDNVTIRATKGEPVNSGSFRGTLLDVIDNDVVIERNGIRWLLTLGDCLNQAFALPPETKNSE